MNNPLVNPYHPQYNAYQVAVMQDEPQPYDGPSHPVSLIPAVLIVVLILAFIVGLIVAAVDEAKNPPKPDPRPGTPEWDALFADMVKPGTPEWDDLFAEHRRYFKERR